MNYDQLSVNTIRTLAMDAVQKANSGHPGAPMGLAPVSHLLWSRFLKYDPNKPSWWDRDRFVLSCGHASMLLYAQLHLAGFELSLDELKQFRQWNSKTPGHPEFGHTAGVETTTGPLGQGFSNAVGMALAEKHLAARFNRDETKVVDHYTYVFASDGDIMEGVCQEAASLAGHWQLGKLIVFYDDNSITIDGATDLAFTEDVAKRFEAYGWHVQEVADANDLSALEQATKKSQAEQQRPSLIIVKTCIGFGSPNKQGKSSSHGAPLGEDEITLTKAAYDWKHEAFFVPEEVRSLYAKRAEDGAAQEAKWQSQFEKLKQQDSVAAEEFNRVMLGQVAKTFDEQVWPDFLVGEKLATRQASSQVLQALADAAPELIGGSADLACSNNTLLKSCDNFSNETPAGRNIHFGIREHAMGAIANGLALHGGVLPYTATFLIFSDYMRPSIRLAALMNLPTRYVFTHDSIALGEDGPTHQPIEQLMTLRAIPNVTVIRPADSKETLAAWQYAAKHRKGPVLLSLTRQAIVTLAETKVAQLEKGAYILAENNAKDCELILLATGSEVSIAYDAFQELQAAGVGVRLVSMPSWELFAAQSQTYRDTVLPPIVKKRISIEAGITFGWQKYVGEQGASIGVDHFGASAPAEVLYEKFGITKSAILAKAQGMLKP